MSKVPARLGEVQRQIVEVFWRHGRSAARRITGELSPTLQILGSSRPPAPPRSARLRAAVAVGAASAVLLAPFLGSAAAAPPTRRSGVGDSGVGSPDTPD